MDQILIEVKGLETGFYTENGVVKAVDKISFNLNRQKTIGIVGESGSGKSVTSLSIMRLIQSPPGKITAGEIIYHPKEGEPVNLLELTEKEMQGFRGNHLAMIFQEPMTSLNPVFRCGHQITEAIQLHQGTSFDEAKTITLELLEKVQLPDPERVFNAYPHEISGGQKQRVMIAMAMSCKPDVLIADEPTTALDVTVQKHILALMSQLKKEIDASIIFITHDLGVIAEIADEVLILYKGKIVEQGTVESLFKNPQHPYTKSLLACRPPLDYRLSKLPVVDDFMKVVKDENGNMEIEALPATTASIKEKYFVPPSEVAARLAHLKEQPPLLKVENLNSWYTSKRNFFGKPTEYVKAVNDVSFEVYPGETLGLVGESGCGKTTLGRTILRLIKAKSGKVFFKGEDILEYSPQKMKALRRDMQIIFQDPYSSLNPRLAIGEAIMEPMQVHQILDNDVQRKEKVIELLETVSMESDHFNRYPHEFSGGQRQRICIARSLALNPKFIVCDECVSALDVSVQAQVLNLLMDLRSRLNLTYIFISHDLSVVKFMSDRMMVMNDGRIEEIGSADHIYNNPTTAYTRKLIEAIPKGEV